MSLPRRNISTNYYLVVEMHTVTVRSDDTRYLLNYNCLVYKSSAVAEMGDRRHNRHGPKRRGGVLCPFRGALGTRLIQCGLRRCLLPYQVASSSIQPFGRNSVGCHRNISTNYYLVVEMHTVTIRTDDARYLLNYSCL